MKRYKYLIVLLLLTMVAMSDLAAPGLADTHDAGEHITRISSFYQSLSEGIPIPRWAGNLNWGFGHPILMFLYPLPSYLASVFHSAGFSFANSIDLVYMTTYVLGIVGMYAWASRRWNARSGFVAGLVYGFAPYRFVDMYVRGALGEHVAFAFMPLVLLGIDGLKHKAQYVRWASLLSLSTAGLLLSHNAISLMFAPIAGLYVLYVMRFEVLKKRRFILRAVKFTAFGFLISAFFWLPAFVEGGKYTLRDIVTEGMYAKRFVSPLSFLYMKWNYGGTDMLPKNFGITVWVSLAGLAWTIAHSKKSIKVFGTGVLLIVLLSTFLMTQYSVFVWNMVYILQKFQFPWRFLTVIVLMGSVAGAVWIGHLKEKTGHVAAILLLLLTIITSVGRWQAKDHKMYDDTALVGIHNGTTDTGESSPIWSVRFMEHTWNEPLEVIDGIAEISQLTRTSTEHRYEVSADQESRLVENTLYFPGWRIFIGGVEVSDVQFQDPEYRGLMTFNIPEGTHEVKVVFGETKFRSFANWLSALSMIAFILVIAFSRVYETN